MPAETDRLIIEKIREGDARAWDQLIARDEGRLLAFVNRRIQDRAASEDIVQETFVGFLTSLPNFDDRRELQTYLFTIASHKLTDHLRRLGRHPLQHVSDGPDDVLHQRPDRHKAASSEARSRERKALESEAVARALGQIIAKWRTDGDFERLKVLELLFIKGWANCDVAAHLKIKEQQVANYRFAALKRLGELLRDAGLSPDVFPELRQEP